MVGKHDYLVLALSDILVEKGEQIWSLTGSPCDQLYCSNIQGIHAPRDLFLYTFYFPPFFHPRVFFTFHLLSCKIQSVLEIEFKLPSLIKPSPNLLPPHRRHSFCPCIHTTRGRIAERSLPTMCWHFHVCFTFRAWCPLGLGHLFKFPSLRIPMP